MLRPTPPRRSPLGGNGAGLGILAIALVLITAAAVAYLAFDRGTRAVDVDTKRPAAPIAAPAEWSPEPRWTSPDLLPRSGRVLVPDSEHVAVITADRKILFLEAESGRTVWAGTIPDADLVTPPAVTRIGETPAIAAQFGDALAWWSLKDGTPGTLPLTPGSRVTFAGAAPLVRAANGTVGTATASGVQSVTVPSGATALAARPDGIITAASAGGWWHLQPGRPAGPATPWQTPIKETGIRVVGYLDGAIVTTAATPKPVVSVFADRPNDVRHLFSGRSAPTALATQTWTAAPTKTWGIYGRTMIDLDQGAVTDLGAWTTRLISGDRALGAVGGKAVVAGPRIRTSLLTAGEGFPEALTRAGAVVRSRTGDTEVVHLLPPR